MQKRVVCVRRGDKYGPEYVTALRKMVERWVLDAEFYCLSDSPNDAPTIPLEDEYPGWWSKLEMFGPNVRELAPFLFVDLDTLILGNIDDIFSNCGEDFWMLRDFNRPDGGQSAQIWVTADVADEIWDKWSSHRPEYWMSQYRGDQDFLETFNFKRFQDSFSGMMSYKVDKLEDGPGDARIVHFHGKPKPMSASIWASEMWNGYAKGN